MIPLLTDPAQSHNLSVRGTWGTSRNKGLRVSGSVAIVAGLSLGFLVSWFDGTSQNFFQSVLLSRENRSLGAVFGYVFAYGVQGFSLIWFALSMAFMLWIGRSIEAAKGWQTVVAVFVAGTVLHGLAGLAATYTGPGVLWSHYLPQNFMLAYWAGSNPKTEFSFWSIRIQLKWLVVLFSASMVVFYGIGSALFGVIVTLPVVAAWFWGANGLPKPATKKKGPNEFDEFMSTVRSKEKKRAEDERLRKLFEDSMSDQGQDDK